MKKLVLLLTVLLIPFSVYAEKTYNGITLTQIEAIARLQNLQGAVTDGQIPSAITRDSEWDTAAEINAATTDNDFAISGGVEHDSFSDYEANEHIDWTVDQGETNIDPGNYPAGGGSGSVTTIKENDVQVGGTDIVTLDFLGADFTVAESPDTEIQIGLDYTNTQKATNAQPGLATAAQITAIEANTAKVTNTDDQTIDSLSLGGTTLSVSLEGDGEAPQTVDLSSLQDGTGTDDQTASEVNVTDTNGYTAETTVEGWLDELAAALGLIDSAAEIKSVYEGNADTNAYTDAEKTKVASYPTAVAKGDMISATGAGAWGITSVGTNDYVPTADSSQAGGWKWAAQSGGVSDIVDDTTPQLGGDLDLNTHNLDFPTTPNISDVLDEDNMSSNPATVLATQQSIKAYVDAGGSVAASDYYVDTGTGSDSNACTASGASACNTIQGALGKIEGLRVTQDVTIHLTGETYQESFNVPNYFITGDYFIYIEGTTSNADTGTFESSTQLAQGASGAGVTVATVTDTDKSWTIDTYSKQFLHLTGGTGYDSSDDRRNWYVIFSNTATALTVIGRWNTAPGADTTYAILNDLTTIIDGQESDTYNTVVKSNRIWFQNIWFQDAEAMNIHFSQGTSLGGVLACYIDNHAARDSDAYNVGGIGDFRQIACYSESANDADFHTFIACAYFIGDYDEEFATGGAGMETTTGIKGNWFEGGGTGLLLATSHTRFINNFIRSTALYGVWVQRQGNVSSYNNIFDMDAGYGYYLTDGSLVRFHQIEEIDGATEHGIYARNSVVEFRTDDGVQVNNCTKAAVRAIKNSDVILPGYVDADSNGYDYVIDEKLALPHGNVSTNLAIDITDYGYIHSMTMTGNSAITFTDWFGTNNLEIAKLYITNGGDGDTVTIAGVDVSADLTAVGTDIVYVTTIDGGSNYYVTIVAEDI